MIVLLEAYDLRNVEGLINTRDSYWFEEVDFGGGSDSLRVPLTVSVILKF